MALTTILTNNFSSGEISPKMAARVDHPAYQTGCRELLNFIPMSMGGIRRRPGTYFLGSTKGSAKAHLIPWIGKDATYVVELTDSVARFWKTDHTLLAATATTEVATPWDIVELMAVQHDFLDGLLYVAHGDLKLRSLTEGTPPTLASVSFTDPNSIVNGADASGDCPSVVGVNNGRLTLGATGDRPDLLAQSRAPSATVYRAADFTTGTNPDHAIVSYHPGGKLQWFKGTVRFAAGSVLTTFQDSGVLPTPASFYMSPVEEVNSPAVQAEKIGRQIFYAGGPFPSLRMLAFSEESGGMVDLRLSEIADHILKAGVSEIATMQSPEKIVWVVRSDGKLVSCTMGATGWGFALHELGGGGLVESACVIRGAAGDELWMSVNRDGARGVEYLVLAEDDDIDELHYVDAGIRYSGTATTEITGLDHLDDLEVIGVGDGGAMPAKTVAAGTATYDFTYSLAHVGLSFTSRLRTVRPEVVKNSTWQGKKKKVEQMELRLYNTPLNGKVGDVLDDLSPIPNLAIDVIGFDAGPVLESYDLEMHPAGYVSQGGSVYVQTDEAWSFNLLALMTRFSLME